MASDSSPVTTLLQRVGAGDSSAREVLFERVYDELRAIARAHMERAGSGHTLQPTALVHEAYLRLVKVEDGSFESRKQFYALAARIMRGLLVDHWRGKNAEKRGNGAVVSMHGASRIPAPDDGAIELLDLGMALEDLAAVDPDLAQVAELRYLGGLPVHEVAEVLEQPPRTVERRLRTANLWLKDRLRDHRA